MTAAGPVLSGASLPRGGVFGRGAGAAHDPELDAGSGDRLYVATSVAVGSSAVRRSDTGMAAPFVLCATAVRWAGSIRVSGCDTGVTRF